MGAEVVNDNAVMTQLDTERELIGDEAQGDPKIHAQSMGTIDDARTERASQKSPIKMENSDNRLSLDGLGTDRRQT